MDILLYVLPFLAGIIVTKLFTKSTPNPFESMIWRGLYEGKRVVVSIDSDAFIFEMIDNRLRMTRGTSEMMEESYVGSMADRVDNVCDFKSTDNRSGSVPDNEG